MNVLNEAKNFKEFLQVLEMMTGNRSYLRFSNLAYEISFFEIELPENILKIAQKICG
jgi:hypothetical protein